MRKLKSFLLVIILYFISCDIYRNDEIIEKGNETLSEYKSALEKLVTLSNTLVNDTCSLYEITTSRSTNGYSYKQYLFDFETKKYIFNNNMDIDSNSLFLIKGNIPKKIITDFIFCKENFVVFGFDQVRNKKHKYASLVYCKNKNKFLALFPTIDILTLQSNKDSISDWIYFYNENWAIASSLDVFQMGMKCPQKN